MIYNHIELTDETLEFEGHTLHRIRATKNLPERHIHKGTLGGWVESVKNVGASGWIADDAKAFGDARVRDSLLYGTAVLCDGAVLTETSTAGDECRIDGGSVIRQSKIFQDAHITDATVIRSTITLGTRITDGIIWDTPSVSSSTLQESMVRSKGNLISDHLVRTSLISDEKSSIKGLNYTDEILRDGEPAPHALGCEGDHPREFSRC